MCVEPPAHELAPSLGWLNTDRPLRLSDELKGHVVVLDFWTYCCINCMHVIPDLAFLEEKYKDDPVVVIGVHSAKFTNESQRESIRNAVFRYGVHHPVVIDRDFVIWNAYKVRGWPSFAIIGADGNLVPITTRMGMPVYTLSGEGNREVLDKAIEKALAEGRAGGSLAAQRVEFKLDASVPSATGLSFPGKVVGVPMTSAAPGWVFIADSSNHRVLVCRWARPSEGADVAKVISVVGGGVGGAGGEAGFADGDAAHARFNDPQGMAYDAKAKVLYVADTKNHSIRVIDLGAIGDGDAGVGVRTLVGDGTQQNDRVGGKAGREQRLSSPWDLVLTPDGKTMYVAMAGVHQLWKVDVETGQAAAFAGSGREDLLDGPVELAMLAQPSALALNAGQTRLYFADSEVSAVRYVDLADMEVHTVVGRGLFDFGDVSSSLFRTRLQHPLGVGVWNHTKDGGEGLVVADTYNHKVKLLDLAKDQARVLLGVGRMEEAKSRGDLVLDEPGGVCVAQTASGVLVFVADTNNHRIIVADPTTGSWRELVIDGLMQEATGAAAEDATSAAVTAALGKGLALRLFPTLPEGAEPNPEAPVSIRVSRADGSVVAQRTVRAAVFPVTVEIPGTAVVDGAVLGVELNYAACTHGDYAICLPGSAAWRVTIKPGEATSADLRQSVRK